MVYKWLNIIRSQLAFRTACDLCGTTASPSVGLCPACLDDLPVIPHPCPCCGLSLSQPNPGPCGACQHQPPAFDAAFIPFAYAPPLNDYITGLKFHSRLAAARLLGELLIQALPADLPDRPGNRPAGRQTPATAPRYPWRAPLPRHPPPVGSRSCRAPAQPARRFRTAATPVLAARGHRR